jgi:hypothetical protein
MKFDVKKMRLCSSSCNSRLETPPPTTLPGANFWTGPPSRGMQREFANLRKQYWGQRMWARGYFACTTGNVTDEMVRAYIEGHARRAYSAGRLFLQGAQLGAQKSSTAL